MRKKNPIRKEIWLMFSLVILAVLFVVLMTFYYRNVMEGIGADAPDMNQEYQYLYEMIVDSRNITFWEKVYEDAAKVARENGAVLELNGTDMGQDYDKADFMDMSIAAQVNGIILEYNGEENLGEKINEAVEKGIPVVTIVNDAPKSLRQSFVGINDYQLGLAYGAQVATLVDDNTKNVLVLLNREKELGQNQIYAEINRAVAEQAKDSAKIKVQVQNLMSKSRFDAEEAIRNIFQSAAGAPEILVCLDEVTTECAYQAMIDFNMVGEVKIVGYYTSKTILDGVKKGLIPVTFMMDTKQIGTYSVEALTEYLQEGHSNSYYTVDLNFITKDNWKQWQENE